MARRQRSTRLHAPQVLVLALLRQSLAWQGNALDCCSSSLGGWWIWPVSLSSACWRNDALKQLGWPRDGCLSLPAAADTAALSICIARVRCIAGGTPGAGLCTEEEAFFANRVLQQLDVLLLEDGLVCCHACCPGHMTAQVARVAHAVLCARPVKVDQSDVPAPVVPPAPAPPACDPRHCCYHHYHYIIITRSSCLEARCVAGKPPKSYPLLDSRDPLLKMADWGKQACLQPSICCTATTQKSHFQDQCLPGMSMQRDKPAQPEVARPGIAPDQWPLLQCDCVRSSQRILSCLPCREDHITAHCFAAAPAMSTMVRPAAPCESDTSRLAAP